MEREEQKVEYMPVQSMQVEVGGIDGRMTLASAEGRGEIRKRKKDIGGDTPVLRCVERASFAHVVIRPSACSQVTPHLHACTLQPERDKGSEKRKERELTSGGEVR